jgi:hypothetical protein
LEGGENVLVLGSGDKIVTVVVKDVGSRRDSDD